MRRIDVRVNYLLYLVIIIWQTNVYNGTTYVKSSVTDLVIICAKDLKEDK